MTEDAKNRILVILDDKTPSGEHEFIWVDKEWKDIIEKMCSTSAIQTQIVKGIAEFKRDIDVDIECAGELVSNLKRRYEEQREEMRKFYREESELTYALWEELDKKRSETHKKIAAIKEELNEGLKKELLELQKITSGFNIYGLDKILETLKMLNNMSDKDKELISLAFGKWREHA